MDDAGRPSAEPVLNSLKQKYNSWLISGQAVEIAILAVFTSVRHGGVPVMLA